MSAHRVGRDTFHYKWSRSHKPVISVDPGDTAIFEVNDVESWQITEDSTAEDFAKLDWRKGYPLAGPVYVRGSKPGDALVVEVLDVKVDDFGWSGIFPPMGILEEFKKPYLHKWDLTDKKFAHYYRGVKIPIRPFCGVMGVAPAKGGMFEVMPPGRHGGNMDIRHLTAGSKVRIPILVQGALFSTGDIHAAMGDGEVCVTAIECAGTARLRFGLEKNARLKSPQYETRGEPQPKKGYYATTGISPDLMSAAKESVRNMIGYLRKTYGFTKEQAYVLCSVVADVRVHEVVDRPNWVVGTMISRDIFP